MINRAKFAAVLLVFLSVLALVPAVGAQSGVDQCAIMLSSGYPSSLGISSFDDCLNALNRQMIAYSASDVYGAWGQTAIHIQNSDIYVGRLGGSWSYLGSFNNAPPTPVQTGTPLNEEQTFELVEQDLNAYWEQMFNASGRRYISPTLYWGDTSFSTACGRDADDETGPFYCTRDHSIYFPAHWGHMLFQDGDFALATSIAHEWGHAIQNLLGLTGRSMSIVSELQADCFAGTYAQYIETQSQILRLDEGDLEEGARELYSLGDPGTPWFDPQAHGTGEQRYNAFAMGLRGGVSSCLQ